MVGDLGNFSRDSQSEEKIQFQASCGWCPWIWNYGKNRCRYWWTFRVQDRSMYICHFRKINGFYGAFVATKKRCGSPTCLYHEISDICKKSLPMALVIGAMKGLRWFKPCRNSGKSSDYCPPRCQTGLRAKGFNLEKPNSCVTPDFMEGGVSEATQLIFDPQRKPFMSFVLWVYTCSTQGVIMLRIIQLHLIAWRMWNIPLNCFTKVKHKLDKGLYPKGGDTKLVSHRSASMAAIQPNLQR